MWFNLAGKVYICHTQQKWNLQITKKLILQSYLHWSTKTYTWTTVINHILTAESCDACIYLVQYCKQRQNLSLCLLFSCNITFILVTWCKNVWIARYTIQKNVLIQNYVQFKPLFNFYTDIWNYNINDNL